MIGWVAPLLSHLNDLRIMHTDGRGNENIIKLEPEKKPAIAVKGGRIAMVRISYPESVHQGIRVFNLPFPFGVDKSIPF